MIPLNLLLALTLVMVGFDNYQIIGAIRGFEGTYHFATELFEGAFSTTITAVIVLIGLVKSPAYRSAKVLFLVLLFLDILFDVLIALQTGGKTPAQVAEATKQMSMGLYYLLFQFPAFVGCVIYMTSGISFQMRKPFFHLYARMKDWQSRALWIFALFYYLEAILLLLLVMGVFRPGKNS